MDAGDHWAKRRQLDVIISMKTDLISYGQRVITVRAMFCNTGDVPVRVGSKRPKHSGTSLSLFRRAALGAVGLAPLRWRHRGVVRGLGWPAQLCFELGGAPGQLFDLCRLRLDLCRLGQHQRDQLFG